MIALLLHNWLVYYQLALLFCKAERFKKQYLWLIALKYLHVQRKTIQKCCLYTSCMHHLLWPIKLFTAQLIHYKSNKVMLGIMTYSSCYPTTLLHIHVCWCVAAKNGVLILNLLPILCYCKYVPLNYLSSHEVEEL